MLRDRNLVLVVADDFGVDLVGAYGEGSAPPCTENLDAFAAQGLLFRNAWANPSCAPTRASFMTGRYGFRTGIGTPGQNNNLSLAETTIPEALPGYSSSCIGKWHLASGPGRRDHPNDSGFGHFAGSISGGVNDYFNWQKTVDGNNVNSTTYATVDNVDDAIVAMATMPEPWFLVLSFNAPHSPYHVPPVELCASSCTQWCESVTDQSSNLDLGKAMVEAMDAEFGRFVTALDAMAPHAYTVFVGDNGTTRSMTEPPFNRNRAKGSVYEGGVNVPFIVRGPGVVRGESQGLVSVVDLFATFTELGGATAPTGVDSVSLVPYFRNPDAAVRELVYSETFEPNGPGPYTRHDRTVRNARYKLIRRLGAADEFYDLALDPFETTNLLPSLTPAEQVAFDQLEAELVRLGVD